MERLLEKGGQPNTICTGNVTPLMSAVMSGKLRVAEMLLKHCSDPIAAINRQRDDGTTPINLAAGAGQAAAVQWLIDNGADVNLIQVRRRSPWGKARVPNHTSRHVLCCLCRRMGMRR